MNDGSFTVLAENLRKIRIRKNLTQRYIAKKLNLDRSTYSYYELGETQPSLEKLVELSKLLEVSADQLLGLEPICLENIPGPPHFYPERVKTAPAPRLAETLLYLRSRWGLTVHELADILSLPSYKNYERHSYPYLEKLAYMARVMNVHTDCLLGLVPPDSESLRYPSFNRDIALSSIRLCIPAVLKFLRGRSGVISRTISDSLGIPLATYRSYESGCTRPSYPVLIKIAYLFGVSVDFLLGLEQTPEEPDYQIYP